MSKQLSECKIFNEMGISQRNKKTLAQQNFRAKCHLRMYKQAPYFHIRLNNKLVSQFLR